MRNGIQRGEYSKKENIIQMEKKTKHLFLVNNAALFRLLSLGNAVTRDPLLPLSSPLRLLSPPSLSSQTSCSLFPSIKPLPLRTPHPSLGGRKPARHPETAGVDTFRLRVSRCCLNAHLSETSPSRSEGKKKQKKNKSCRGINLSEGKRKCHLMSQ